ncbi:MAG: zinc ABC transporter substrate-binding protein [Methanomicrobium sp.]|nr:zinc ABC transporter substrate-binding protein [Methanomicrobium sp.]
MSINKASISLLVLIALIIFSSGCTGISPADENPGENTTKITVSVSILPEEEFAKAVGGSLVNVNVMIPPGSSPHTYELTPGQLKSLAKTDLYAMTGSGIEFELAWMEKIKGVSPDMKVINCSSGIELISGPKGGTDPHIWLSPSNAKIMAENICDGLIEISPENEQYFLKNLGEYKNKLDVLDTKIRNELSGREGETILVYHPAWSYFAGDYSLNVMSVENEGKEPGPAELLEIIRTAREKGIKVIFASPEQSTKSAEVIAEEINGTVVFIDTLPKNYLLNMESAAEAFAKEYGNA